jgi:hypothetical protein
VPLSPALSRWKQQLERRGGLTIAVIPVRTDTVSNQVILPPQVPYRAVVEQFLASPGFWSMFVNTHAVTINYLGLEANCALILLNLALADQFAGDEEAVLAHEFGHIELNVRRYPGPRFVPRSDACRHTIAADMLQHVFVRRFTAERRIDTSRLWSRNAATALEGLRSETLQDELTLCQEAGRLLLAVDVAQGLESARLPQGEELLTALADRHPDHVELRDEIVARLRRPDLADPAVYRATMTWLLGRLEQFPDTANAGIHR